MDCQDHCDPGAGPPQFARFDGTLPPPELYEMKKAGIQDVQVILLAASNETFHTNPKRKRGNALTSSLALRVSIRPGREQYRNLPHGWAGLPRDRRFFHCD